MTDPSRPDPHATPPDLSPPQEGDGGGLSRLRARLPDLLIEAAFVFFAVLLALAADEWRERKDRAELADRALAAILHEIRANREELLKDQEANLANLQDLERILGELEQGVELEALSVNYKVALTSRAAWETGRMSQAVHFLDLELMTNLAELYELQAIFERAQNSLVDSMTDIGARVRGDPRSALEDAAARMSAVVRYRQVLIDTSTALLATLE